MSYRQFSVIGRAGFLNKRYQHRFNAKLLIAQIRLENVFSDDVIHHR